MVKSHTYSMAYFEWSSKTSLSHSSLSGTELWMQLSLQSECDNLETKVMQEPF